ncbi:hypothetical protein K402DRAFT_398460 [Aulographum hederae CBS 113979]|uniref:PXA domain-containing protein n=1 Tax=Aulographum hederae CBS 113979 TaxID=1176131 RepID=A0A6G1GL45_9PEZI|nr:hypothetical protein K402DRAFT_398460 [Aulographum hederae CBS 113979]
MTQLPQRSSSSHLDPSRPSAPELKASPGRGAPPPSRAVSQQQSLDATSDRATAAFIRRTLCAHHVHAGGIGEKGRSTPRPLDELLPPLTSSNDVDLQLYALLAIILKEFVYTWYAKITPDHVFVDETIQIIAHCTRALEQRLRHVDLAALLLDEIPQLLDEHVTAYRVAHETVQNNPLVSDPRLIYHTLNPHPALAPVPIDSDPTTSLEQRRNEEVWRQLLVQGVLAVLLPTEDLENGCLRALVCDIFSDMILGNGISGKACEPVVLWDAIIKILDVVVPHNANPASSPSVVKSDSTKAKKTGKPDTATNRLEQFGLLASDINVVEKPVKSGAPGGGRAAGALKSMTRWFWLTIQCLFLAWSGMRAIIFALATSSSLPSRSTPLTGAPSAANNMAISTPDEGRQHAIPPPDGVAGSNSAMLYTPVVSMSVWSCVGRLVELEQRMPWLSGLLALVHWGLVAGPGKVGNTDGVLDRILMHRIIKRHVLDPARLPSLLRTLRAALFPGNAVAGNAGTPTTSTATTVNKGGDDETSIAARRRRACARRILNAVPEALVNVYFVPRREDGTATGRRDDGDVDGDGVGDGEKEDYYDDSVLSQVEAWLDVVGDPYLNRHLAFRLLEVCIVRVLPEMGEMGVKELMAMRLG